MGYFFCDITRYLIFYFTPQKTIFFFIIYFFSLGCGNILHGESEILGNRIIGNIVEDFLMELLDGRSNAVGRE